MSSSPEPLQDDPPDLHLMVQALVVLLEDISASWEAHNGKLSEDEALRVVAMLHAVRRFREAHE